MIGRVLLALLGSVAYLVGVAALTTAQPDPVAGTMLFLSGSAAVGVATA